MRIRIGLVAVTMLALAVVPAWADTITLQDLGTTATIQTTDQAGRVGMTNWSIDGTNYLYEQWFWVRVGDAVGQTSLEQLYQGYTQDPGNLTTATMKFATPEQVTIDIVYGLLGGGVGSGTADITEQIRIRNLSGRTQTIHFYQYCDFDLGGVGSSDTVWMDSATLVSQTNGLFRISETSAIPSASRFELGLYSSTLSNLNGVATYDLANAIADWSTVAPVVGDATWAFQWDVTLTNGAALIISKDKHLVVPEPLTMISGFLAISSLGMYLRRRTAPKA